MVVSTTPRTTPPTNSLLSRVTIHSHMDVSPDNQTRPHDTLLALLPPQQAGSTVCSWLHRSAQIDRTMIKILLTAVALAVAIAPAMACDPPQVGDQYKSNGQVFEV